MSKKPNSRKFTDEQLKQIADSLAKFDIVKIDPKYPQWIKIHIYGQQKDRLRQLLEILKVLESFKIVDDFDFDMYHETGFYDSLSDAWLEISLY